MSWNNHRLLKLICALGLLGALGVSSQLRAETKLELEEAKITGARELPKVLYIVPWKKSQPELSALPMRSLVEERLTPVDMDEFRREVHYFDLTQPGAAPKP